VLSKNTAVNIGQHLARRVPIPAEALLARRGIGNSSRASFSSRRGLAAIHGGPFVSALIQPYRCGRSTRGHSTVLHRSTRHRRV
jgi:hypothetical protein